MGHGFDSTLEGRFTAIENNVHSRNAVDVRMYNGRYKSVNAP